MPNNIPPNSNVNLVNLEEIFKIQNSLKKKNGEIAITILTPKQTVHAIPIDDEIKCHKDLAAPVYDSLFGQIDYTPSSYCIEIRYAIYDTTRKDTYIILPQYITKSEYDELNFILTALSMNGFTLLSLHTDFEPTEKTTRPPKFKQEIEGSEILSYLKENGFVRDYELPFTYNDKLVQDIQPKNIK